ncbi:MAG: hypothetical protein AB7N91_28205 [Candidatus Tectimicrobiota bacterium]
MIGELVLIGCLVGLPFGLLGLFSLSRFGRHARERQAKPASQEMTLKEGETLYGVIEKGATLHFICGSTTRPGKAYE